MEHSHIPIEGLVEEIKHHFDESENISPYLPTKFRGHTCIQARYVRKRSMSASATFVFTHM